MKIETFEEIAKEVKQMVLREMERDAVGAPNAWMEFGYVKGFLGNLGIEIELHYDTFGTLKQLTVTLNPKNQGSYSIIFEI